METKKQEQEQEAKLEIKELDEMLAMVLDYAMEDVEIAMKNDRVSIEHYEVITNLLAVAYERMKSLEK